MKLKAIKSLFILLLFFLTSNKTFAELNILKIEVSNYASYSKNFNQILRTKDDILTIYYDLLSFQEEFKQYEISIYENDNLLLNFKDTLKISSISIKPTAEAKSNLVLKIIANGIPLDSKNIICYTIQTASERAREQNLNYYYLAAGVIIILFFIGLYFIVQKLAGGKQYVLSTPQLKENARIIEDLRKKINELEFEKDRLKERIAELKKQVKELEDVNDMLIEKKEKLLENQNKLSYLKAEQEKLFAAYVHDLKNPASNLYAFARLIQSYQLSAEEQSQALQSLIESSEKILKLAENISKIAASSESVLSLNIKKTKIKKIIDKVCLQNKSYASRKNINIINKTSDDLPEIECDEEKIEIAIENIINNAIKYTGPEKNIIIQGFFTREKVIIEIIDEGQGIKQEELQYAFQKGKILSSKPTGGESQSGLGLWIVKNIVEDHKGKISIESKLGIGTKVTIELPSQRNF